MSMTRRVTFVIAATFLSGALYAQSPQAIRDQLFGPTDAVKKQADDMNAKMLAPKTYAEGQELYVSASDTLEKGKDLDRVRRDLGEAKGHFEHSIEASKLAQATFTNALAARESAKKAESEKYAAKDWKRAEEALVDAATTLEDGNLNKATKSAADIEHSYREAETKALAAKARGK